MLNQVTGGRPDLLGIALAYGLALAVMNSALGSTSGGHFNPAVTFGFCGHGAAVRTSAITYWISQVLGAVVASFLLRGRAEAKPATPCTTGATTVSPLISPLQAAMIEFVLTFFLVTAVWGHHRGRARAAHRGVSASRAHGRDRRAHGGPPTGAAMNPARVRRRAHLRHVGQSLDLVGGAAARRRRRSRS